MVDLAIIIIVMLADQIEGLLILQERDRVVDQLLERIEQIPQEVVKAERHIAEQREAIASAKQQLRSIELARKELENQVASEEERVRKYLTQQMQVKKNDEYTALTHEISSVRTKISGLEDQILQLMEDLDGAKVSFAEAEAAALARIHLHDTEIASLRRTEQAARDDLASAIAAKQSAETDLPQDVLTMYGYVRTQGRRPPFVVPMRDGICGGCHLKVSGSIESALRNRKEWVRCERCGRIIYQP